MSKLQYEKVRFREVEGPDCYDRVSLFGKLDVIGNKCLEERKKLSFYSRFAESADGALKCIIVKCPSGECVWIVTTSYAGQTMNGKTASTFSGTLLMVVKMSRSLWEAVGSAFVRTSAKKGNLEMAVPFTNRGLSSAIQEIRLERTEMIEIIDEVDMSQQDVLFNIPDIS